MVLSIYQIVKINRSLEKLLNQQLEYSIRVAYKIFKLQKSLEEIEHYAFERFSLLYPKANLNNLSGDEQIVYETILSSIVEVDNFNLTEEEVFLNEDVKLTVEEVSNIMMLFQKNE